MTVKIELVIIHALVHGSLSALQYVFSTGLSARAGTVGVITYTVNQGLFWGLFRFASFVFLLLYLL